MKLITMTNKDSNFYTYMGKYLSKREIVKELGMNVWDDNSKVWLLVIDNDECIGFSSFIKNEKMKKAYLKSSWVVPKNRNRGLFNKLFSKRLEILKGYLIEGTATELSKGTYLRFKFTFIGMKGKYYRFRKEN
jgi:hypothetical protein